MKLEKRNSGNPTEVTDDTSKGKKPVVIYIMFLFIAAFLLMAWSFVSHQRSNTEALGRLQSSVSAMQEVQDLQDQVIALQKDLAKAIEAADDFQNEALAADEASNLAQHHLERTQEAMEWFWQLDERYLTGDIEMCETILAEMEKNTESPMSEYLTPLAADRYQEIRQTLKASNEGGEHA